MRISRSWRPDFAGRAKRSETWYDLYEDWDLIESSIAAQYGIRLRNEPDMTWDEFSTLVAGLLPETPLGYIVQIRSENDREKLKHFTPEQKKIRAAWRTRNMKKVEMSPEEARKAVEQFEKMMAAMFGGGGENGRK